MIPDMRFEIVGVRGTQNIRIVIPSTVIIIEEVDKVSLEEKMIEGIRVLFRNIERAGSGLA